MAIPTSLDEVLVQAQTDFANAVGMEGKRLRLDILVPGLNEQVFLCLRYRLYVAVAATNLPGIPLYVAVAATNLRDIPGALWHDCRRYTNGETHNR